MKPQPEKNLPGKKHTVHTCDRHSDLSILLNSANKQICNTCFATIKKSYFNLIAGILLETHWLHNMIRRLVDENSRTSETFREHQEVILKLQAEITEVKNNGKDHEDPQRQLKKVTIPDTNKTIPPGEEDRPAYLSPGGHVSQARKELEELHQARKSGSKTVKPEKNAQEYPKTDDLQDASTNTAHDTTKSTGQIIEGIQHNQKH